MSVYAAGHPGQSQGTIRDEETARFRLFVLGIVTLNVALLVLAAQMRQSTPRPAELVLWVVLVAIAGFVPLSSGRGPSLAMDLPLLLAAAFVFGPLISGMIALLGAVDIREVRREISWSRALWNRSQTSISVMCASVAFATLAELGDWPLTPLVALVALGVDMTVNYVIVGYGTSLRTRTSHSGFCSRDAIRISSYLLSELLLLWVPGDSDCGGIRALWAFGRGRFCRAGRSRKAAVPASLEVGQCRSKRWRTTTWRLSHVDERIAAERQQERARIAAALHDEVLQDLYNVTIRAQVLRQDLLNGRLLDLEDDLPRCDSGERGSSGGPA